ncbi:hypothetical protein H0H92_012365 [Tricholoma furcatifolium]|nr:hypothetical protein H0H92_012365 [Tricholoma furcatifolium]
MPFFAIFAILVFIIISMRCFLLHYSGAVKIHRSLSEVKSVLSPPLKEKDILASRALANKRLIKAFALTNTFVSPSPSVHKSFLSRATSLLKYSTEHGWNQFQSIAVEAVDKALPDTGRKGFDTFIQDVAMQVALVSILGIEASAAHELDLEDIRIVSNLITSLWSLSKKAEPIPTELLPRLNHHLRRLVPDDTLFPNPLDFVIPAWETTWRVVATSVAYAHWHPAWSDKIFSDLHNSPCPSQFRAFHENHPSVEWFITEAMRLHPPSNRISRTFPVISFPFPIPAVINRKFFEAESLLVRECADIGAVLRDKNIWGPDALMFAPFRFHPSRLTPEQNGIRLLPFGQGKYRCVATTWAPLAVGIISAAVLDRLQDESYCLIPGKDIGGREGWEGWSISAVTMK